MCLQPKCNGQCQKLRANASLCKQKYLGLIKQNNLGKNNNIFNQIKRSLFRTGHGN